MRKVQPPGWPRPSGYSHAVSAEGRIVFVSGQIGWNARGEFEADDFVGQAEQALANTTVILSAAGAEPKHIARMTWYVLDKTEYLASLQPLGRVFRRVMQGHYPAMSVVEVSNLLEPQALLEIETTAVVPRD